MKIAVTRSELCDLMLACTICGHGEPNKWTTLHDKLAVYLTAFDAYKEGLKKPERAK